MDQSTEGDDEDGPSADNSRKGTFDGFDDGISIEILGHPPRQTIIISLRKIAAWIGLSWGPMLRTNRQQKITLVQPHLPATSMKLAALVINPRDTMMSIQHHHQLSSAPI